MWWLLVGAALGQGAPAKWHRHTIAAGIGHNHGSVGLVYLYRPGDRLAVGGGLGVYGVALLGRYHPAPWRPFFVGTGLSPLFYSDFFERVYYGPDVNVGLEWSTTHLYLAADVGLGFAPVPLNGLQGRPTFDLAIGYNFRKPKPPPLPVVEPAPLPPCPPNCCKVCEVGQVACGSMCLPSGSECHLVPGCACAACK